VGDHDRGHAQLAHLLAQEAGEHPHAVRIEPDRGLVEEQQAAPAGQRARHRHALRLPARQPIDRHTRLAERAVEPDPLQPGLRIGVLASVPLRARGAVALGQLDVAAHVQVIEQRAALRDETEIGALEGELSAHHLESAPFQLVPLEEQPCERGLTGATAAQEHHHLSRNDLEGEVLDQHPAIGEHDAKPARQEAGHHGGFIIQGRAPGSGRVRTNTAAAEIPASGVW
jgi:hypothetical protein